LLTDEIIKRYFYREGLYTYYVANNPEIQKGLEILKSPTQYGSILH
jgi:carboxyl-terminal processing protease